MRQFRALNTKSNKIYQISEEEHNRMHEWYLKRKKEIENNEIIRVGNHIITKEQNEKMKDWYLKRKEELGLNFNINKENNDFIKVGNHLITHEQNERMKDWYLKKKEELGINLNINKENNDFIKVGNHLITHEQNERMKEWYRIRKLEIEESKLIKIGNHLITHEQNEMMKQWYNELIKNQEEEKKIMDHEILMNEEIKDFHENEENIKNNLVVWWQNIINQHETLNINELLDENIKNFEYEQLKFINNEIGYQLLKSCINKSRLANSLNKSSRGFLYLKNKSLKFSEREMKTISLALKGKALTIENEIMNTLMNNGYYLFHKYLLEISNLNEKIEYQVIQSTSSQDIKNKKYFAHLHCFNIDEFYSIYSIYLQNICKYFSVIVTYSIGENKLTNKDFIIIKIPNKGMDIGAKFCCVNYLNNNNIEFEYILFLHSKKCPIRREKYFKPLILNLDDVFEDINQFDGYVPDMMYEMKGNINKFFSASYPIEPDLQEINHLYRNDLNNYLNVKKNKNIWPEGNCYILSKKVINKLFGDPILYNILNTDNTFDYNFVNKKYKIKGDIYEVYREFKKRKLAPRNDDSWDGYIEHAFERVVLNCCDNYKILDNKLIRKITNKYDFRKLCNFNLSLINNIIIPDIELDKPNETFYIEFRKFRHCEFIIRNVIIKLPDWSHTIICGNLNYEFMKKMANLISPNIKIVKLDINNLNTAEYSRLLMSKEFWNNFKGEKLLLYQEDSYMFHNRIDEFLEYDYIGAPWPIHQDEHVNQREYGVGNGGFSLRSKSKMIEVIEKINWEKDLTLGENLKQYMIHTNNYIIPEDVYFSKSLLEKNIGKVAPRNIALKFSQETQKSQDPLGGHNFYLADNYKLPNYNRLYLNNNDYYLGVDHRGGWKSIIQYGLNHNIISNNFLELSNIILEDCCESNFVWDNKTLSVNNKWIGITHCTYNVPKIWENCHIDNLLNNNNFIRSLDNCAGLIVLSNYMKKYLSNFKIFKNIPIYSLKHPIDKILKVFDLDQFLNFNEYNLVLLGQQLRNFSDIFKINSSIINKKIWLSGISQKQNREERLYKDLLYNKIISDSKKFYEIKKTLQTPYLSNFEEYDKILTSNIILIPLYNASANNSVLEIIQTNTPAFITRLPATEEYLGKDYPMFYTDISEVNNILNDRELFNKKYIECHNYLKNMDKSDLTYERFYSDLLKIINDVY